MPQDPMTSAEQAEAEADERQDDARREQHWREAEQAARTSGDRIKSFWHIQDDFELADTVLFNIKEQRRYAWREDVVADPLYQTLIDFEANYGTPALLRAIATALEHKDAVTTRANAQRVTQRAGTERQECERESQAKIQQTAVV